MKKLDQEALKAKIKDLATDIDFDALIKAGVLEKKGAGYRVLKMDELPSHARLQISRTKSDGKITLVKFKSNKVAKKLGSEILDSD
jgi:hypothetical protein